MLRGIGKSDMQITARAYLTEKGFGFTKMRKILGTGEVQSHLQDAY